MTRSASIPLRRGYVQYVRTAVHAAASIEGCPDETARNCGETTASAAAVDRRGWRCGAGTGCEWGWVGDGRLVFGFIDGWIEVVGLGLR